VWPQETAPNSNLAAQIIEISAATGASYGIILPQADMVSVGSFVLVNNLSAYTQVVQSYSGTTIASIAPGAVYFLYIQDNTTAAGQWFSFQYGTASALTSFASAAGAGLSAIGATLNQSIPVITVSANYQSQTQDLATFFNCVSGCSIFTLPLANSARLYIGSKSGWFVQLRNSSGSTVSLQTSGSDLINGVSGSPASITLNANDSCIVVTDGTSWYTIGLGTVQPAFFNFQLFSVTGLSSPLIVGNAGSPSVNKISYKFTGALTGNMIIQLPAYAQTYWINNVTTGAYSLTFQVGAGPAGSTVVVSQGSQQILYADGANVINAVSGGGLNNPVSINQGGTGVAATSTAQALAGLGGTTLGITILQAASNAVAQTALSSPSTADAYIWGLLL
jgi:hypothetical protein